MAARRLIALLASTCLLGWVAQTGLGEAQDTAPKLVKLPELINAIKAHKGKVVVVDFWADG